MIGILGGTFDPVHYGHLKTARELLDSLHLEQIRFIPCGIPPHREPPVASAQQRMAMVQLAIDAEPGFLVDDREIRRGGVSYMVDTLQSLRAELGKAQSMGLIIGLDAFLGLDGWHRWQELIELAHLLVMNRPGYSHEKIQNPAIERLWRDHITEDREDCDKRPAGRVLFCKVIELAISSTAIRQQIRSGEDVAPLIPGSVLEYIKQQEIYS